LLFINAMVVPVRLFWFHRRLKEAGASSGTSNFCLHGSTDWISCAATIRARDAEARAGLASDTKPAGLEARPGSKKLDQKQGDGGDGSTTEAKKLPAITWDDAKLATDHETRPRARGRLEDDAEIRPVQRGPVLQAARSIEKAASSAFVLGDGRCLDRSRSRSMSRRRELHTELP
jgi:hypothetical protein